MLKQYSWKNKLAKKYWFANKSAIVVLFTEWKFFVAEIKLKEKEAYLKLYKLKIPFKKGLKKVLKKIEKKFNGLMKKMKKNK